MRKEIPNGIIAKTKKENKNRRNEGRVQCKDSNILFFIALKGVKLSIIIEGGAKKRKGVNKNPINNNTGCTEQNKIPVKKIIVVIMLTNITLNVLEYASFIELVQFFLPIVAKSLKMIEDKLYAKVKRIMYISNAIKINKAHSQTNPTASPPFWNRRSPSPRYWNR